MHFAIQPARLGKKTQELPARGPDKAKHTIGCQLFGPQAGVGLDPPAEVLAAPRSQPMAARCIPYESNRGEQDVSFCIKYRPGAAAVNAKGASLRDQHDPGALVMVAAC